MSYFDDNEDRIIYGRRRKQKPFSEKIARAALAAPPGSELARARIAAHAAFDPLWKSGWSTRRNAYVWLARQMQPPVDMCHMVLFNVEQCQQVVEICGKNITCRKAQFDAIANDFEDIS